MFKVIFIWPILNESVIREIISTLILNSFCGVREVFVCCTSDNTFSMYMISHLSCEAEEAYKVHYKSLRTVSVHPTQKQMFATSSTDGYVYIDMQLL